MRFRDMLPLARIPAASVVTPELGPVLGRIGNLEVRLATTRKDIRKAQKLRFNVFYEEMGAVANTAARLTRRDKDAFDAICDHLLVLDHATLNRRGKPAIVGTYRLLRGDVARAHQGFYSSGEFDLGPALARHPDTRLLELGRSCVLAPYRNKRTVELLWHGIWTYVLHHKIDVLFGCASFEGTDPARIAMPMAFLKTHAGLEGDWDVRARPGYRAAIPAHANPDAKMALLGMPPLIKGYLRLGARFGQDAVVDRAFGTTDVFVVLQVAAIEARYISHFGAEATRYAS